MSKEEKWEEEICRLVEHYQFMERYVPGSSMLLEVKGQYRDMAAGGDGGELGFSRDGHTTCRGINYPNHPDFFFKRVIEEMGW